MTIIRPRRKRPRHGRPGKSGRPGRVKAGRVVGGISPKRQVMEKLGWRFGRTKDGGWKAQKGKLVLRAKCCFARFLTRVQAAEVRL